MRRILLATDGSPASESAETEAVRLCVETGAELLVVHVWQEPGTWLGEPYYGRALERLQVAGRETLARPLELADRAGIRASSESLSGRPGEVVVAVAESFAVDLVVVGAHNQGTVSRLFLGSVSREVLERSTRPVVVVKEGTEIGPANSYAGRAFA